MSALGRGSKPKTKKTLGRVGKRLRRSDVWGNPTVHVIVELFLLMPTAPPWLSLQPSCTMYSGQRGCETQLVFDTSATGFAPVSIGGPVCSIIVCPERRALSAVQLSVYPAADPVRQSCSSPFPDVVNSSVYLPRPAPSRRSVLQCANQRTCCCSALSPFQDTHLAFPSQTLLPVHALTLCRDARKEA